MGEAWLKVGVSGASPAPTGAEVDLGKREAAGKGGGTGTETQ